MSLDNSLGLVDDQSTAIQAPQQNVATQPAQTAPVPRSKSLRKVDRFLDSILGEDSTESSSDDEPVRVDDEEEEVARLRAMRRASGSKARAAMFRKSSSPIVSEEEADAVEVVADEADAQDAGSQRASQELSLQHSQNAIIVQEPDTPPVAKGVLPNASATSQASLVAEDEAHHSDDDKEAAEGADTRITTSLARSAEELPDLQPSRSASVEYVSESDAVGTPPEDGGQHEDEVASCESPAAPPRTDVMSIVEPTPSSSPSVAPCQTDASIGQIEDNMDVGEPATLTADTIPSSISPAPEHPAAGPADDGALGLVDNTLSTTEDTAPQRAAIVPTINGTDQALEPRQTISEVSMASSPVNAAAELGEKAVETAIQMDVRDATPVNSQPTGIASARSSRRQKGQEPWRIAKSQPSSQVSQPAVATGETASPSKALQPASASVSPSRSRPQQTGALVNGTSSDHAAEASASASKRAEQSATVQSDNVQTVRLRSVMHSGLTFY